MTLHLAEISAAVAPGAHAVLLLGQAGWHGSRDLVVPDNVTRGGSVRLHRLAS